MRKLLHSISHGMFCEFLSHFSIITEWPDVIVNDGLLTANQHLKEQCTACQETSRHPELVNVVISSVQPDSTFRLLCTQGTVHLVATWLCLE